MTPGKRKEVIIFGVIGLALVGSVFIAISGKVGPEPIGSAQSNTSVATPNATPTATLSK